jgi:hypothetical protein
MDYAEIAAAFRRARWGWMGIAALVVLVSLVLRAQRWRVLLGRVVSLPDAFGLMNIGYLVSNILPMRLGDPAKAVAASLRSPITAMAALSTVVVERILDMLTVVFLMLVTLPFIVAGDLQDYLTAGWVSGGLALGMLIALVLVARFPDAVEQLAERILTALHIPGTERWLELLHNLLLGLQPLRSPREGAQLVFWSLAHWGSVVLYFQLALRAFVETPPTLGGTVVTWAAALGMILPAPGGIGAYHKAVQSALSLAFGIPGETALAYATAIHAISYLTAVALGAGALLIWGLSLKSVISRAQGLETAADEEPAETETAEATAEATAAPHA